MRKAFVLLLLVIVTLLSCERDDICIDEITPHLVVRFFDNDDPTNTKQVIGLDVKVIGLDSSYTHPTLTSSTDSILVPLNTNTNSTQFILTLNSTSTEANIDTLTVNYSPETLFVGRSCGFKSVFNNTGYQLTSDANNWIQSFEVISQEIENETAAHVKIFH